MSQRMIVLVGGPMDGIAHELQKGFPAAKRSFGIWAPYIPLFVTPSIVPSKGNPDA